MAIRSVNPATGETIEEFAPASPADVDRALTAAEAAYRAHRHLAPEERAGWLRAAAGVLRADRQRFARTMALEMGKPLAQGEAEVEKCASGCELLRRAAARRTWPPSRATSSGATASVRYDAAGRRARGHAVELPLLAGVPLRGAGADRRQRGAPEARAERAAVRARDRGRCSREAGLPQGLFQSLLAEVDAVPRDASPTRASSP